MAQRPGKAVDTAHPSGTINPGDSFVANRYVMNVDKHPPEGEADGASPWGGMSGAALFAGRLLIGVIASDQAGFPHSRLAAVPAYVLWANPGFHAAMAEHAPQMCTALEPAELQHLHSVLPPIASVAELLEARRAVVPLRGRGEQLHELLAWATSPTTDSRLLHGPARHGKTRLAYELGSRLSHQGWAVLWLRTVTLATEALDALADTVVPLLVVVDDADGRSDQIIAVLETLTRHNRAKSAKLLLLAEREEWLHDLLDRSSTVEGTLGRIEATALPALELDLGARGDAYREAAESFARCLPKIRGWEHHDFAALAVSLEDLEVNRPDLDNLAAVQATALTDLLHATGTHRPHEAVLLRSQATHRLRMPDLLLRYLDAAMLADELPYPALLPDDLPQPDLSRVYLSQRVQPQRSVKQTDQGADVDSGPVVAERILERHDNCLVTAAAGGGKTSLLRTVLVASVKRWAAGRRDPVVPVLVPAAVLAGRSLPEAIAKSLHDELAEDFPPDFFSSMPLPRVPWLVLVDGLDEITDADTLRRILARLAGHLKKPTASPYRFIITTRPLPEGWLANLGEQLPRFALLPFDEAQLRSLATGWFTALSLPDPGTVTAAFVAEIVRNRLSEPARIPLMASMLCQLHAHDPGRRLPEGRSEAYRLFINLLYRRQHATPLPLKGFEDQLLTAAQHTQQCLPALIDHLAAERHAGNSLHAVDWLVDQPDAACPVPGLREVWIRFLTEILRRSGLLTQRGRDFAFLHQTILEYLAARHTAASRRAADEAFRDLFGRWTRYRPWERRFWESPSDTAYSYAGFLLDAWRKTDREPDVTRALHSLARRGGNMGRSFITEQAALGTLIPESVISTVADGYAQIAAASDSTNAPWAATKLITLGDPRGREALARLANEKRVSVVTRRWMARDLAGLGDTRGARVLEGLAHDSEALPSDRVWAARDLVSFESSRGLDALATLARTHAIPDQDRVSAAESLAEAGDSRGAEALAALADDPSREAADRLVAAKALASCGDRRGFEALVTFATVSNAVDAQTYDRLLHEMVLSMEEPRRKAVDLDIAALTAAARRANVRREAARTLARLGDPRGLDILAELSDDLTTDYDFLEAARTLAQTGNTQGLDALAQLVEAPSVPVPRRRRAAETLARFGDGRGLDFLADLAASSGRAAWAAAQILAALGDGRGLDALASAAAHPDMRHSERVHAASALALFGDARGRDMIAAMTEQYDPASWEGRLARMRADEYTAIGAEGTSQVVSVSVNWETLSIHMEVHRYSRTDTEDA
ncbi:NACHT domain-containing protein [Streptomyces phaeofaciens]|nr:NACHT domain-containing protein [Streptomyces phaeofaciens]